MEIKEEIFAVTTKAIYKDYELPYTLFFRVFLNYGGDSAFYFSNCYQRQWNYEDMYSNPGIHSSLKVKEFGPKWINISKKNKQRKWIMRILSMEDETINKKISTLSEYQFCYELHELNKLKDQNKERTKVKML